jgi:hypothetical protein
MEIVGDWTSGCGWVETETGTPFTNLSLGLGLGGGLLLELLS